MEYELNERVLPEDYKVHSFHLYVCDGKVIRSTLNGTVADLKKELREFGGFEAKEIKSCDIIGRKLW
jgi:hypothetical protein